MRLTKKEEKLLIGAIFIAAAVLFLVYVYFPLDKDINTLKIQQSELSNQIQQAEQRQESVLVLKKQISDLQEEMDTKYDDFLKLWDQPQILVFMEDTINSLGLKESVDFLEPVENSGTKSGDISMAIKTNYNNLKKLISKLEKAKYFNTVSAMDIVDSEDDSSDPLEVNLILSFYSQESTDTYPDKYSFMNGKYKKSNIFE
ncbi:MAG: hypothetical protein WCD89_15990 [Anaerocolumna sp.]